MDRNEALRQLATQQRQVPEGEEYTVDFFRPEDGPAVARLFYAVYGDAYPIDTYYIPERLIEENRLGNIRSAVARTTTGNVVAHVALYRSSPPNQRLYECGVGLTLPHYRHGKAFFHLSQLIMQLVGTEGIDGYFGESVCNHTATQKMGQQTGGLETAVEMALMPAETYRAERHAISRVSCIVSTRVDVDSHRKMYLPAAYRDELRWIMDGLKLDREVLPAASTSPAGKGIMDVQRFAGAGVARCTVQSPGQNLTEQFVDLERELRASGYALIQFFINLGKPWAESVAEQLRGQGYFFGGLLPIWFEDDGFLLQKPLVVPDFDGMRIYSERGRSLVELVKKDWLRAKEQEEADCYKRI